MCMCACGRVCIYFSKDTDIYFSEDTSVLIISRLNDNNNSNTNSNNNNFTVKYKNVFLLHTKYSFRIFKRKKTTHNQIRGKTHEIFLF